MGGFPDGKVGGSSSDSDIACNDMPESFTDSTLPNMFHCSSPESFNIVLTECLLLFAQHYGNALVGGPSRGRSSVVADTKLFFLQVLCCTLL